MTETNIERVNLFISYSRHDSAFVDKLDIDLRQRGFDPWVDREHLEGSDKFHLRLEGAIKQAAGVLVVIPPESVELEWVRREIQFARDAQRVVVPLHIRQYGNANMINLNLEQYVDFAESYDQGMEHLLTAIYDRILLPLTPPDASVAASASHTTSWQKPQPLDPRLTRLYTSAQETEDLERRNQLYEQILAIDPTFANGLVAEDRHKLQPQLQAQRFEQAVQSAQAFEKAGDWRQASGAWQVALNADQHNMEARQGFLRSLRHTAQEAYRHGRWIEEIGAWEALLGLSPDDPEVIERLPIAVANLERQAEYEAAVQLVPAGNAVAARRLLEHVWQQAPYYGDPDNVAPGLGLTVPPTVDDLHAERVLQQKQQEQARQEEEARRRVEAMLPRLSAHRSATVVRNSSLIADLFRRMPEVDTPELLVPRTELAVGEPFIVEYRARIKKRVSIKQVLIELVAVEELECYKEIEYVTHDPDTGTETRTRREYHLLRASQTWVRHIHDGGQFHAGQMLVRQQQLQIPLTAMHTFKHDDYAVRWYIRLSVDLNERARSVACFYDVKVLPRLYT